MHVLAVNVKQGLPFARERSEDSHLRFIYALLHPLSYFLFFAWSPSSSLGIIFNTISSNMNEVLSISPSANVFGFGGFDVNHMDWLTYSSGTDRPGRLRFNFPITNDLTQMINFPPRMPDSDSQGPTVSFISSDTIICSTATFPSLGNSDHVVVQFPWISFEFSF